MEERPCEGATGVYISHGAENGPDRSNISVNNDQDHSQFQNEKTQTKKTENGRITGTLKEGEVTPTSLNPDSSLHPVNSNGDRHLLDINLKQKPTRRAFTTDSTGDRKGRNTSRNSMDFKNDKSSELNTLEGKKEALATLNGVVSLNSVPLANGYPSKPGADNDGSGSESGYTTPKKRRAQRNGKAADNVTASAQGKAMQQGGKQDHGPVAPDSASGSQVESGRAGSKAELHLKAKEPTASATPPPLPWWPELQRQELRQQSGWQTVEDRSSKVKVATSTKEDSWTLFKLPPVFPVDNSAWRPPQVAHVLAVKTITSASFSNGPLLGEGNGCPLPGPHFSAGPLLATPTVATENVASPSGSGTSAIGSSTTTSMAEPRKPSLFVYPDMQLSLPSGRQADPPAAPTNQKSLGDIFQNQWGLSFINEPSAGPENMACRSNGKEVPVEVSFQGGCPATVATQTSSTSQRPDQPPFPTAHEPEKRTNAQNLSRGVSGGATAASGAVPETSAQRDETRVYGAIEFCSSSKDICAELPPTSPAAPKVALAKDQGHTKGFDRRNGIYFEFAKTRESPSIPLASQIWHWYKGESREENAGG
ncbi:hypothetical protein cypCar_00022067 [Cyprinus carpio]|nr:hypothetical protein cypCar_00022067 [Cyprinus carpio]